MMQKTESEQIDNLPTSIEHDIVFSEVLATEKQDWIMIIKIFL